VAKHIQVTDFKVADDLFLKSQTVHIGGKKFQTPIKVFDASKMRDDIQIKKDVRGINEIFKTFNSENLNEYIDGEREEGQLNLELDRKIRKTEPYSSTICFVGYDDLGYPNDKGINFLMDLTHEFSDAIPMPSMSKLFVNDNRDIDEKITTYFEFLQKCMDSVNQLNNKPIIGIIPEAIPSIYIEDLVNFYFNNDITSFVYDFNGKVSVRMRTKIRRMMIAIRELGIIENTFLYAINANYGKMLKDAPIVRAKDVLTFGFGFDALGDQHIRRPLPPHVRQQMKEKGSGPSIRLFDTRNYGYCKTLDFSVLSKMYPVTETSIPFKVFEQLNHKAIQSQSLFNSERIGKETIHYQTLIKEQADETSKYFESKKYVQEKDIKDLERFKKQIKL